MFNKIILFIALIGLAQAQAQAQVTDGVNLEWDDGDTAASSVVYLEDGGVETTDLVIPVVEPAAVPDEEAVTQFNVKARVNQKEMFYSYSANAMIGLGITAGIAGVVAIVIGGIGFDEPFHVDTCCDDAGGWCLDGDGLVERTFGAANRCNNCTNSQSMACRSGIPEKEKTTEEKSKTIRDIVTMSSGFGALILGAVLFFSGINLRIEKQ